ncbi:DUF5333 domain-containing protein [Primorskyibacter flagellatus]|uniref:DUF5333 domain-containing protein n=1 Tax=Primorskyibacter flagellatus TaxID=1387277 RepID=UPI003A9312AF
MALKLPLILALLAAGTASAAQPPLSSVKFVNDGLRNIAIADEIRSNCGSIGPRMIAALQFINKLENHAQAQGYSKDEIEDFVKSKADRKRLEAEAKAFLVANGATNESGYCALGRKEIARNSQVGALLRAK